MAVSGEVLVATADFRLAALSIAVAMVGSYTAIDIAEQIEAADRNRNLWLIGSGLTLGLSIWAMHFTAILAHQLPIQVNYDFTIVFVSMVISIAGSILSLLFLNQIQKSDRLAAAAAGFCLGITIIGLHYCAMQSLRLQALISYEPTLAIASGTVAVSMSTIGFLMAFRSRTGRTILPPAASCWRRLGGTFCLGGAICGMHYVAMYAAIFRTTSVRLTRFTEIDNAFLAIVIAVAALSIVVLALLASGFGRRLSAEIARTEALQQSEIRLERLVQQRTQELEAANQAKTEFLSYVSHELRTPLASVISFSKILQQQTFGALNSKQQQYVEIIQSSGQYLLELINDLLDLSKIEAGQEELTLETVSIEEICTAVLTLVGEQADARHLQLHLMIEPNLNHCVADKRRLKQILLNLLANAINYTEVGSVTLRVTRSPAAIDFAVTDTGIGISPGDQELLFQPFQQVGRRDRSSGTGLGLALSRNLARRHGGDITCTSTLGEGSCFALHLPLRERSPTE